MLIRFTALPYRIDHTTVLRLPEKASKRLPSRGQVAVHGTINGRQFETVVDPDGTFGHWMRVDKKLVRSGDEVTVEIEPSKKWPEPELPADFEAALHSAPNKIQEVWKDITPMARWEWVRWVNATPNPDTRRRRVEVSMSTMSNGKRRPCCFDLSSCTDPQLAKNGRLRAPVS